jgi:hypothetical protein
LFGVLAATGSGCASAVVEPAAEPDPVDPATATIASPDAIAPMDDPANLLGAYSRRLSDHVAPADVGKTFSADRVPYPDTYWPYSSGGIDVVWNSPEPSPLDKYMALADPGAANDAKSWEHANHGTGVPSVATWFGHCPGWTAAAVENAPILHPVRARIGASGVQACTASDPDPACIDFAIGDLDALLAEVYTDGLSYFVGARCDQAPAKIRRDANGRIVRDGSGCKGLNAAALVITLGERVRKAKKSFALDAQNDYNTDQIWNQPAYAFTVNRIEPIAEAAAANLVAHGTRTGDLTKYAWNGAAHGFAFVDLSLAWVSETSPNISLVSGTASTRHTRVTAVLELDRAATDAQALLLGGEFVQDDSVGTDRLTVPPFVWIPTGAGPEDVPSTAGGDSHNPYVRPSIVRALVALGQAP